MKIELVANKRQREIDNFVNAHPQGHFFCLTAYGMALKDSLGYENFYFLAKEKGKIIALLHLFEFKDLFFRKRIFSPFGILFAEYLGNEKIKQITSLFKEKLLRISKEDKISSVEIRNQISKLDILKFFFQIKSTQQNAILSLGPYEEIYKNFDRQIKKAINKARKNNVRVYSDNNITTFKKIFYPLYSRWSKERHGTPPQSFKFFAKLLENFPNSTRLYIAEYNGKPVAALLGFFTKKKVFITHNPSLSKYNIYRANDLLHSIYIKRASDCNFEYFDFGPARYEGQIRYKKKWGAKFIDSASFCFSLKRSLDTVDPSRALFKIFPFLWKHLMFKPITDFLGPFIRRKMGR